MMSAPPKNVQKVYGNRKLKKGDKTKSAAPTCAAFCTEEICARKADSPKNSLSPLFSGGEGGIRTHGTRKGSTVFETARFNHSRTSPRI